VVERLSPSLYGAGLILTFPLWGLLLIEVVAIMWFFDTLENTKLLRKFK
jgi:hypothetical protein